MTRPTSWLNALFAVFFLVGFSFASWMARTPHVRGRLGTLMTSLPVHRMGPIPAAVSLCQAMLILLAFGAVSWLLTPFARENRLSGVRP